MKRVLFGRFSATRTAVGRLPGGLCAAAISALLTLAACAESAPGCSDERVLIVVRQIMGEQIEESLGPTQQDLAELVVQRTTFSLATVRTTQEDNGTGARACVGVLVADAPPAVSGSVEALRTVFGSAGQALTKEVKIDGSKLLVDVAYTSALTDDRKQIVVSVEGVHPMVDVLAILARQGLFEPQPVAPPVPLPAPVAESVSSSPVAETSANPAASNGAKPQPSFSCAGRLARAEKLICESVALSSFDASLAKSYAEALQRSADPAAVKQKQRAWIKERNACADEQCLIAVYGRRADELTH